MAGMLRPLSVVCGLTVGSVVAVKTLNYLRLDEKDLKASGYAPCVENAELELVLVQVLFRHGARTPLKIVPRIQETVWDRNELLCDLPSTKLNYSVKDLKNRVLPPKESLTNSLLRGGCGRGQLTVVGQQQTYELGKELRRVYIEELKFIGGSFDPRLTFLRTTNVPRTIDSLRCLIGGMFDQITEPLTFWTIPVHEEFLFPNWQGCNTLSQFIDYWFKNGHKLEGYQNDLDKFFAMIGGPVPHHWNFIDIFDDLSCRRAHNKAIPEKIKGFMDIVEKRCLQHFSAQFWAPPSWTKNLILPLSTGQMLQHLFDNMKKNVLNNSPYKLRLFSVHDTSLIGLLCSLDMRLDKWPPFASYVALELFKNKNEEHFVQVVYCGKVMKPKDCNRSLIPLTQFEKMVSRYFVDDIKRACQTVLHPPES